MDVMTLMLSSMQQSSATPVAAGAVPGQPGSPSEGQVVDASGKARLFASLLGTLLQGNLSGEAPEAVIEGEKPATGLPTQVTSLLSQAGAVSAEAVQPESETGDGKEMQAMSLIQLLQKMQSRMNDAANKQGEAGKDGGSAEGIELLAAELLSLSDRERQLYSGAEEQLRGFLTQTVAGKSALLDRLGDEAIEAKPGDQDASDQLVALLTTLNGLLPQAPLQSLDKKVETGKPIGSVSFADPAMVTEQQNAAMAQGAEAVKMANNLVPKEVDPVTPRVDSDKVDSGKPGAADFTATGLKVADSSQHEIQPKSARAQNPGLIVNPDPMQSPVGDGIESTKLQQPFEAASIEVVIKEDESIQELQKPAVDKLGSTAADKRELPRTDVLQTFSSDGKSRQLLADNHVSEDSLNKVSREQIVTQVREKLAEHRFTQENGQVTIRLNPADLGELKVSVRMENQSLRVEIVAENRTVKDALMENLGSLKEALAKQNIEMKQFDVSTGSRQFFNQGFREGRQQEQQYVAPRQAGWLMGRADVPMQAGPVSWKPRDNALLDMMM